MFNFLKKNVFAQSDLNRWAKSGVVYQYAETDVMGVVEKGYPKVVQEIHNEFNTAGDKLLQTANEILAVLSIPNKDKAEKLSQFGFNSTKQAIEASEAKKKIEVQKEIADTVTHFKNQFPTHKFITKEIAIKICEKYNLVLGGVDKYMGFVPEKNLTDIELFFKNYPDERIAYYRSYRGWGSQRQQISKEEFEEEANYSPEVKNYVSQYSYTYKSDVSLDICAPIMDMDMKNMKLEGRIMVADIPDPIVLLPKKYGTIEGFIILTAWGDEASDEMVANHQNN